VKNKLQASAFLPLKRSHRQVQARFFAALILASCDLGLSMQKQISSVENNKNLCYIASVRFTLVKDIYN